MNDLLIMGYYSLVIVFICVGLILLSCLISVFSATYRNLIEENENSNWIINSTKRFINYLKKTNLI